MRVLLADSGESMRGGQWQVLLLARGLREARHSVVALARGPLLEALAREQFEARRLTAPALAKTARAADLVHVHDARSHTMAALVCGRRPLVVSRRVAFAVRRGLLSRWKYARADRFLAVSKYVASVLEHAGVSRTKIRVVYDGIETPAGDPVPWRERTIGVMALDTGDAMKGDDLLREAAAMTGLEVRFVRSLDDLRQARVFLYASRSEGLGSAAILAQANGAAVIASRAGGLEEIVQHGKTGLLVENRPADMAAAMLRLTQDSALAERLASAGRASALRRFPAAKMVRSTVAAYRSVLA